MDQLANDVDNLAQEAIDQLPDGALGDDLVGIRRQMDRLEAQFLRRLHRFDRNHERRWFACDQTFDGVFILRGELDAEGGAIVKTALNAVSAPSGPDDTLTCCTPARRPR